MANIKEAQQNVEQFKIWLNTESEVAKEARSGRSIDLGSVGEGTRVVYGQFGYQQRIEGLPGEPLIFKWTSQPTIALEKTTLGREGNAVIARTPLVYAADLRAIGPELTGQVLDRLNAIQTRTNGNDIH